MVFKCRKLGWAGNLTRTEKLRTRGEYVGPKTDENGEWKRFHNEKLHNFYR
jgi:hypothetical protein